MHMQFNLAILQTYFRLTSRNKFQWEWQYRQTTLFHYLLILDSTTRLFCRNPRQKPKYKYTRYTTGSETTISRYNEKKRSERRKHCALAVVMWSQKFSPRRRPPFTGVQDRQNLISWRWSLPAPTDPVWWRLMHAILSYHGNRHRPPARCKHAHRQDR